jgi:hypothetical protein
MTNLCQCRLQIDNLEKLIFVHKNWPIDLWSGYKGGPKSMADVIKLEVDLVEELEEEFEGAF